jgi:hypothetical protein
MEEPQFVRFLQTNADAPLEDAVREVMDFLVKYQGQIQSRR